MNEFKIIDWLQKKQNSSGQEAVTGHTELIKGIGDDAAVLSPFKNKMLVCSDALVEGVHFDLNWFTPEDVAVKAINTCMSDIAAMNGKPRYALLTLGVRPGLDANLGGDFTERLLNQLIATLSEHSTVLIGGDTVTSPEKLFLDVTLIGESSNPIYRSGAKAGDEVWVSGHLGLAAAGLELLRTARSQPAPERQDLVEPVPSKINSWPKLNGRQLRHLPRLDVVELFARENILPTAMIDISDGLFSELHHLARSSNVGFKINEALLPIHADLARAHLPHSPLDYITKGGEDYELLFTVSPAKLSAGGRQALTQIASPIGIVTQKKDILLISKAGNETAIQDEGFRHNSFKPDGL